MVAEGDVVSDKLNHVKVIADIARNYPETRADSSCERTGSKSDLMGVGGLGRIAIKKFR